MDLQQATQQYDVFCDDILSLFISSVSEQGEPFASYAPFVKRGNDFFVCLSAMVRHSHNLNATGKASILLIEDEQKASQIFARKRLQLDCTAVREKDESIYDLFDTKFGENASFLRSLDDFGTYKLSVVSGSFILGFGQAYYLLEEAPTKLTTRKSSFSHSKDHDETISQNRS